MLEEDEELLLELLLPAEVLGCARAPGGVGSEEVLGRVDGLVGDWPCAITGRASVTSRATRQLMCKAYSRDNDMNVVLPRNIRFRRTKPAACSPSKIRK